ncbi:LacI family DNA-binding transcriptional regulator [Microbacterium sp.]|uniref:LacI family DNA-binding transcriptional regulator n=1 Tax=Microbacterium sp. TaxID=51671 RepID=UPI003F7308F5
MVSIADVARLAGVSATTVSHAISGKRKVSGVVREKVHHAMRELNYVPTRAAQNLALGRTGIIALVVPDIAIEYFAELAKNVEAVAVARGYNVMIATTGFDAEREASYLEMMASRAVDGIVFASGAVLRSRTRTALTHGLPIVLVDEEVAGVELCTIVSDNEEGGRLVAEHLIGLGHRSVLEIQGASAPVTSVRRSEGFAAVWAAHGGVIRTETGDYSAESGRQAAERHLASFASSEITAIFAHNDLMALGAIDGLRSQRIRTPRDVSVVGFDDVSPGRYSFPQLTTVRQDVRSLGTQAAAALLDALESGDDLTIDRTVIPVELVVRGSTKAVRS